MELREAKFQEQNAIELSPSYLKRSQQQEKGVVKLLPFSCATGVR